MKKAIALALVLVLALAVFSALPRPKKFLLPPVSGAAYEQVSGADSAWKTNFAGKTMNHIHTRRKPK